MAIRRRAFLRQAGAVLAALGWSEVGMALLARCQQALAQPTSRKLALLIGINQYPESVCDYTVRGTALNGCLTDVELQRELLIHRFGFQPRDIFTLTDGTATYQNIVAALSDLSQQIKAEDIVLLHFSGLGSQVQLESDRLQIAQAQNSLVPVDGVLPSAESPVVSDLLFDTLGLLLHTLPTQQVVTVLDACCTSVGHTLQGNLRIRSRPNAPVGSLATRELELRQQLKQLKPLAKAGQLPGLVLQASAFNQIAAEVQWSGFSSGLFTYALTQQLWCAAAATKLWVSFNQSIATVRQTAGLTQQPTQNKASGLLLSDGQSLSADGVIRAVEEDGKAQLWLAGLPATVLENANGSLFTVVGSTVSEDSANLLVQLRTRDGLTAKARKFPLDASLTLQPGLLVQEAVRILPHNVSLAVALDNSLERIERVDATSAFAAISRVSSVVAGEPADCLFGKTQVAPVLAASLPSEAPELPTSGYGLFYPDRNAIANTLIQNTEAVKTAINRLTPQLKTLLAIKLLRLTQNQGSSRLSVRATLETGSPQRQLQQQTTRILVPTLKPAQPTQAATIPVNSQIRYRLENHSQTSVYFTLISIDTRNHVSMLPPQNAALAAGETVIVPDKDLGWSIQFPAGLAETYLIFSRAPFTQTAQLLEANPAKISDQPLTLSNPLEVVQAVLQDLHQASSATIPPIENSVDAYLLDLQVWATLGLVYQVVEA